MLVRSEQTPPSQTQLRLTTNRERVHPSRFSREGIDIARRTPVVQFSVGGTRAVMRWNVCSVSSQVTFDSYNPWHLVSVPPLEDSLSSGLEGPCCRLVLHHFLGLPAGFTILPRSFITPILVPSVTSFASWTYSFGTARYRGWS